jgi:Ca2+-binding RTX toxin-like protein
VARFAAVVLLCLALTSASGTAQSLAVTCFGVDATIVGTEEDDALFGTPGPDVIATLGGDDSVISGAGDDRICTGAGNDAVLAEEGNDSIDEGDGTDGVYYFTAAGPVQVNLETGVATGAAGRDALLGVENAFGSKFDDTFVGNSEMNVFSGDDGRDRLDGGSNSDALDGGAGDDTLIGRAGDGDAASFLQGNGGVQADLQTGVATGQGRDAMTNMESLIGSSFNDRLLGNEGLNFLLGMQGNDSLDGRAGFDVAFFPQAAVTASLVSRRAQDRFGTDTLAGFEGLAGSGDGDSLVGDGKQNFLDGREGDDRVGGGGGPDVLFGRGGSDALDGGSGDDKLFGGVGNDNLNGGAGAADSVSYIDSPAGVRADLAAHTATGGEGSDRFSGVEGLSGSPFADALVGDSKPNELFGNDGDDSLATGAGSDFAGGGQGADTIEAGRGRDYCLDDRRGRGCEISGAPAIPGTPDAPPATTTPGPRLVSRSTSPEVLGWMSRVIRAGGSLRRGAALPTAPPLPGRTVERFPTAVRTTAGYEYSAEPVCIAAKRGGVTEIAPPNVVRPVGDDDRREEAWWQATLFRRDASGRFTKRQTKTTWARAQLAGDVVVPGVVVWKDVSGRRAFRSPIAVRVPRGRYVWKGQIYWVRSGGRVFAPVEPHLIRAQTIRHDKNCTFR